MNTSNLEKKLFITKMCGKCGGGLSLSKITVSQWKVYCTKCDTAKYYSMPEIKYKIQAYQSLRYDMENFDKK